MLDYLCIERGRQERGAMEPCGTSHGVWKAKKYDKCLAAKSLAVRRYTENGAKATARDKQGLMDLATG